MARPLTLVITGGNTGLGLAALQSLLSSPTPHYRIIIGSRSPTSATAACASLRALHPEAPHDVLWLPLDLVERGSVEEFVRGVEEEVAENGVDCVVLNAAVYKPALVLQESGWCEEAVVNHFGESWFGEKALELMASSATSTPSPAVSLALRCSCAPSNRLCLVHQDILDLIPVCATRCSPLNSY